MILIYLNKNGNIIEKRRKEDRKIEEMARANLIKEEQKYKDAIKTVSSLFGLKKKDRNYGDECLLFTQCIIGV